MCLVCSALNSSGIKFERMAVVSTCFRRLKFWKIGVERRQIANLIKREEKFVDVVQHSLSNYVTILSICILATCCLFRSNISSLAQVN